MIKITKILNKSYLRLPRIDSKQKKLNFNMVWFYVLSKIIISRLTWCKSKWVKSIRRVALAFVTFESLNYLPTYLFLINGVLYLSKSLSSSPFLRISRKSSWTHKHKTAVIFSIKHVVNNYYQSTMPLT